MKTKNNRYLQSILGAIVAVSAALVLSCVQPDGPSPDGAPAGVGRVALTVSLGNSPGLALKTILPTAAPTFTKYDLVFTPEEGDPLPTVTKTPEELASFEQELVAGTWKVAVTAYRTFTVEGGEPVDYEAATGETTGVTVSPDWTNPVVVTVRPIQISGEAGNGIFTYDVSFPNDITSGTLTLKEGGTGDDELALGDLNTANGAVDGSLPIPSGYYTLGISLTKTDGKQVFVSDEVHIYAGLDSVAEYEFTDDDFQEFVGLAGTLPTLPTDGGSFASIGVYTDSDHQTTVPGAVGEVAGTAWLVTVPASNVGETLYFKAESNGSDTYTVTGSTGELTAAGERGISLDHLTVPDDVTVSASELAAAVAGSAEVVLGDVTINGTGTVDFGAAKVTVEETLTVSSGVTVQVSAGGVLDVGAQGKIDLSGTFTLADGVTGTNNGTVTVGNGGVISNGEGVNIGGTGTNVVEAGGTVYFNGAANPLIGASGDTDAVFQLDTGATFTYNNTVFEIDGGEVTLAKDLDLNSANQVFTVKDGATLTVDPSGEKGRLKLTDTAATAKAVLVGEPGATVILKSGKKLDFENDTGSGNPANHGDRSNFYDASGTQIKGTDGTYIPDADETYVWDATLGGWKKVLAGEIKGSDLKEAIAAAADNNVEIVLGDVTISDTGTVDFGAATVTVTGTLSVPASVTITVATDGELTVTGELELATGAKLTVATGATVDLTAADSVVVAGELTVDGGTLNVLSTETDAFYGEGGKLVLKQGSTVTAGGVAYLGGADAIYQFTGVSGGELTLEEDSLTLISGELTVNRSTSIQDGHTATVAGGKLVIADEATFAVVGDLNVAQNAEVVVEDGGVFFLDGSNLDEGDTDNGTLGGTITIKSGAKTFSTGTFAGSGLTVIEVGGEAYAHATPYDEPSPVATIGGSDAVFNLTSGTFALNAAGYILEGEVTHNLGEEFTNDSGTHLRAAVAVPLTIKQNSTLTIPAADGEIPVRLLTLYFDGTSIKTTGEGSGESAAKIVVYGYLDFLKVGEGWIEDPSGIAGLNFYETKSNLVTSNNQTNVTFTWTADAGGDGTPGWLKESQ